MAGDLRNLTRRVRLGEFEMIKIGARRFDLRDPYQYALTVSWWVFFVDVVAAFLLIAGLFAIAYLLLPGAIHGLRPGAVPDALYFSFETMSGAGGGEMYPATLTGRLIAAAEIITGLAFTAIVTGLVFVRFSKPRAKILFADRVVVAQHNGAPTLMVRVGNGRVHALANAEAHLNILVQETTTEGNTFYNTHELKLIRDRTPAFPLSVTLMHRIDETSPIQGLDAAAMTARRLRLFVTFEALDPQLGATVSDLRAYDPDQIAFGMRFSDMISVDAEGRYVADLNLLSRIEPDPAIRPAAPELSSGTVAEPCGQ